MNDPSEPRPDDRGGIRPGPQPDATAVRVALWRALHVLVDAPPHVVDDLIGLQIADPPADWRQRPDMNPDWTRGFRASIVARARFTEDFVIDAVAGSGAGKAMASDRGEDNIGVGQYVLLGAGLDSFVQRHPELAARLRVFEIDRPGPQAWKAQRLQALGAGAPDWLAFVPVDFEAGQTWPAELARAGFDAAAPAILGSMGVSMYLSQEANLAMLREVAAFAPGSTLLMTFQLPRDLIAPADLPARDLAEKGARASGTPFVSFYSPAQALALAREAGFREASHVSGLDLAHRYFPMRPDHLWPSTGEDLLIART